MPDTSQSNSRRQKFARVWRKLPLYFANKLGPRLRGKVD